MDKRLLDSAKGILSIKKKSDNLFSFIRLTEKQQEILEDDSLLNQMAKCSSGVYLSFETNGNKIIIDFEKPSLRKEILPALKSLDWEDVKRLALDYKNLKKYGGTKPMLYDSFDLIDEKENIIASSLITGSMANLEFNNPEKKNLKLKLYFPVVPFIDIRSIETNGSFIPKKEKQDKILCLGDSITQGFSAIHPSLSYTARMGRALNVEPINQGIGNHTFDPEFAKYIPYDNYKFITIAYGTNDWNYASTMNEVKENATLFINNVCKKYPETPIYAITPIWRADIDQIQNCGTFQQLQECLLSVFKKFKNVHPISGIDIPIHDRKYFQDKIIHPNEEGFKIITSKLLEVIK